MILADTNIFLEILLDQNGKEKCKKFLSKNLGNIVISDFSLHSIGVILFKKGYQHLFNQFINDIFPKIQFVTLTAKYYGNIAIVAKATGLDFDDSYQFCLSNENGFEIATMDKDFTKVSNRIQVHFI